MKKKTKSPSILYISCESRPPACEGRRFLRSLINTTCLYSQKPKSKPILGFRCIYRKEKDMKFLTIEKIKQQLRIDDTCEAELLKDYGDAAEETVLDTIGQTYEELVAEHGKVPKRAQQAALMLVDTWYQYRSPVADRTMSVVPYTFEILLKPLVKL